jgi:phosphopantetheine adenylyltransferase
VDAAGGLGGKVDRLVCQHVSLLKFARRNGNDVAVLVSSDPIEILRR